MLEKTDVRLPPQNETISRPEPDECVMFRDYFTAGLRMPCQDFVEEILKAYNIEMHHLTPNGIAKIALFIWAVKSQRGNLDIGEIEQSSNLFSEAKYEQQYTLRKDHERFAGLQQAYTTSRKIWNFLNFKIQVYT